MTFNDLEIIKIYSTDHYGPEMYEIYKEKQCYGPVMIGLYRKTVNVKILRNNELKSFAFWIHDGCRCDHHVYKFSNESTGFLKSYLLNIAPNELKLAVWVKGGEVNIPSKFERNLKKLKFL